MAGLGEALASATLSSLLDFGLDGGAMTAARSAVGEAVTPRLDGGMFEGQGAPGHGRAARRIVGEPRTRSFGAARRALAYELESLAGSPFALDANTYSLPPVLDLTYRPEWRDCNW